MPNKHESEHISPEQLADYFSGELSEDEEATLEEHLAECAECAERARNVYGLSLVVDQWTARAHGEAYRRDLLVTALAQAEESTTTSSWQERLQLWRERWSGQVEAALGIVLGAPGEACSLVTEGFKALARPKAIWEFAAAEGSVAPQLLPTLGPGAPPAPDTVEALAPGRPQARVSVSGEAREVTVRIEELPPDRTAPLVLLIPEEGGEPRVAEPEKDPRLPYLIARFEEVEPGRYLAAFEPMAGEDE